jgi:serine/threonine protein kinase
LKPENLLLDKEGNIRIADFGMAALEPKGRLLETSCGSPHYASPEIVAGKTYHGAPSDIWSCGIILFALLTGHLPFDDENIRNLLLKVKAGHFTMPPQLSSEAKDLIWRMLDVDPKTRIRMPDIFQHAFIQKYPPKQGEFDLPDTPAVDKPVKNEAGIDKEIMKNLMILWRGESKQTLVQRLLSPEYISFLPRVSNSRQNMEKTFYCLLMRYRQNRLENYRADCPSPNPQAQKTMTKSTSATGKARKSASRNSLTNKPGVVFPQPGQKQLANAPIKPGALPSGSVSAKKALLENKANQNALPYPSSPTKGQPPKPSNSPQKTPKTPPPYPTSTAFSKGQPSPKSPAGPVAAAAAKFQAKSLPAPSAGKKGKDIPLGELSPNKQAITKQFASEIEKAFNRMPSPEKTTKPNVPSRDMVPRSAVRQPTYRSNRPLPLIPMRPAPVPMALRSPQLMGPRSPDLPAQQFPSGSRSPSIAPSMASPEIYQDMFADAPDDDSSASSYDLTKPLRMSPSKQRLQEKRAEHLPVLPFRSGRQAPPGSTPTTPLIIQKEPSTLRISSYVTPRPANPLLAVPTLDKRNVSAPNPQIPALTSPILVDKDFQNQRTAPVRRRTTFRHEFFKEGSMKESDASTDEPQRQMNAAQHPLQARMNSLKEPAAPRRKWSSRLRPGGTESTLHPGQSI